MSIELRPLGVECNIRCQYCYQNPQRDAANPRRGYDLEAMKAALVAEGGPFAVFGGEALLIPEEDLEAIWAFGLERFGQNAVQTNGTLINERHLGLFKRYNVHVGISLDGPGELNDVRWAGTLEATRAATRRAEEAFERLHREGISMSLILTLHRNNATRDKLPALHAWLRELAGRGLTRARLHLLEADDPQIRAKYGLRPEENLEAIKSFAPLARELPALHIDVFSDMDRMIGGLDGRTSCVWRGCDPYTTVAVRGVEGQGQRSNCGRTNKDGIDFTKADQQGYERYLALYQTPQEDGGCAGCRFFLVCKGQCPGTAIDGDWRNRTEHCEVWKQLYGELEAETAAKGGIPLSLAPWREEAERRMLAAWSFGDNPLLENVLRSIPEAHAAMPPPERPRRGRR